MVENKMSIDFKNYNIMLDDSCMLSDERIILSNSIKKVNTSNSELNKVFSKYKTISDHFEPLKSEKFQIPLSDDEQISLPQYFIQLENRQDFKPI
ncbi:hypothetical protein M153_236000811 [Pseudoloma neurophilia]|uniref:Uncharacterized protein n=1 Tax=Pseudoloma neurophilia TaxID=146866 RepID=A0A0R0LZ11_9MICR|nr:hypothetical protein M153_236000811 [Pseudoloma neurophilia]